jgi:hypothetical protein
MTVLVVSHVALDSPTADGYRIVYVGAHAETLAARTPNAWLDRGNFVNIHAKNHQYCELTALYAAPHLLSAQDESLGLVHYRRRFLTGRVPLLSWLNRKAHKNRLVAVHGWLGRHLQCGNTEFKSLLRSHDIVLPEAVRLPGGIRQQYALHHSSDDLQAARAALALLQPDDLPAFDRYLGQDRTRLFNMFVAQRDLAQAYIDWLFPLLSEVERNVSLDGRTAYQARVFGFLGERLLNVFVAARPHLRIAELPVSFPI